MAITIDELVVKLSLDPTQFNAGTREGQNLLRQFRDEVKTTAGQTEQNAAKMADSFSRVTKELLGLGLAIVGANSIKGLVVGTVQAADHLNLMTRALDVNDVAFNKWVNTMRRSGVSAGAAEGGLSNMITTIGAIWNRQVQPSAAGLRALQALGVSHPEWGDWQKYATQVIQGFQNHPELSAGRRAALAKEIPGGSELLQVSQQFNASDLPRVLAESASITHDQAVAARGLTEKFTELQIAIEGATSKIVEAIAPEASKFLDMATDTARGKEWKPKTPAQERSREQRWNSFMEMIMDPAAVHKYMVPSGMRDLRHSRHRRGMADGASDVEVLYQPELGDIPSPRARPRIFTPGQRIGDRFPGLGPSVTSTSSSVDNSKSVHIDTVHLTVPPGTTNPATFADRFVGAVEAEMGSR